MHAPRETPKTQQYKQAFAGREESRRRRLPLLPPLLPPPCFPYPGMEANQPRPKAAGGGSGPRHRQALLPQVQYRESVTVLAWKDPAESLAWWAPSSWAFSPLFLSLSLSPLLFPLLVLVCGVVSSGGGGNGPAQAGRLRKSTEANALRAPAPRRSGPGAGCFALLAG